MLKKSILTALLFCVVFVAGVGAQSRTLTLEELSAKVIELEDRIATLEAMLAGDLPVGQGSKAGDAQSFPIYRIGDTVEGSNQTIVLNTAELKNGEYLELSFTITNVSNEKVDLNGFYAFNAKNDDGVLMETDYYNCDSASLDTVLIPGDKVKGSVCFTYVDPAPIRIYYEPDYSSDEIFVWEISK